MPTYKNNTTTRQNFTRKGAWVDSDFHPSEQRETELYTDNTNLTLVSDEPFYNRVVALDEVSSLSTTTPVTIDVGLSTSYIILVQITGDVTVYLQSDSNTPPELKNWTSADPIIQIPVDGRFTKLQLTGSGECTVIQYK